jgi:DNA ligase-1
MPTKREFLMLAHEYSPAKHDVSGCYVSEKLDGTRCFWDGGVSRGMPTVDIPWANIRNPKTGGLKKKIKPLSTGLWSRYGNPIIAPDWWLNQLPCLPLDGELWAGRGNFQLCRSICAKDIPGDAWKSIEFAIIGSPPLDSMFADGLINNHNMTLEVSLEKVKRWLGARPASIRHDLRFLQFGMTFEEELAILRSAVPSEGNVYLLKQKKLPATNAGAAVEEELSRVLDTGGEGLVIRNPDSIWTPTRSHDVLKYKPFSDSEGTVVGYTTGRETDRGSKLLGMIGALILDYNGHRLELSGLTDAERQFDGEAASAWAAQNPGVDVPQWVDGRYFHRGQSVTFKYRELSDDGIPKEARYMRPRTD